MDSNLTSCNRCGHTSSQEAEVCAYCGADLPASGETGTDKSATAGPDASAVSNQADVAAAEPKTAATVVEMPVTHATENADPREAVEPIAVAPEPVNDTQMNVPEAGIEISETQGATAADEGVIPGEDTQGELPSGEDVQGPVSQEDYIVEKLQSVSNSNAEPMSIPTEAAADSDQDREKLVFDLPAETSVADIIPGNNMDTAASETATESDSSALKTADPDTVEPQETLKAAEAPADVISLVRELAAGSQPESPADASENELEISIEPIEETPKPEEQAKPEPPVESVTSEQLEDAIVLPLEAEVTPVEIDLKDSIQDSKSELADSESPEPVADQKETESLIIGDAVVEKTEPVLPNEQGPDSDALPEPPGTAQDGLDSEAEAAADEKKAASKAQIIALKKRKLAKIAALKKKKMALAKAKALEKKKAVLAKAQALKKKKEAQTASDSAGLKSQLPEITADASAGAKQDAGSGISALLEKYKGQSIGINYDNLAEIAEADLIEVNEAYFSVMAKDKKVRYSFPVKTILSIQESEDGVEIEESGKKTNYKAVVKVFPVVLF